METLTGKIEYAPYASSSKSESTRPFLITDDGNKILLYKKNDNPFENKGFTAFEGKRVTVHGGLEKDTFVVSEISEASE